MKTYQLTIVLFLFPFCLNAQDYHLSQYNNNFLYLSPSLAGTIPGYSERATVQVRQQWPRRIGLTNSFGYQNVSIDSKLDFIGTYSGIGFSLTRTASGAGFLSNYRAELPFSITILLQKEEPDKMAHLISLGAAPNLEHYRVNLDKLEFGHQHDGQGGTLPSTLTPEIFDTPQFTLTNFSIGLSYLATNHSEDYKNTFSALMGVSVNDALSLREKQATFSSLSTDDDN